MCYSYREYRKEEEARRRREEDLRRQRQEQRAREVRERPTEREKVLLKA
jgi:hypothetical protein